MLSEYEQYRERNLAERALLFEKLKLPEAVKSLNRTVKKQKVERKEAPLERKKCKPKSTSFLVDDDDKFHAAIPLRRSERLKAVAKYNEIESSEETSPISLTKKSSLISENSEMPKRRSGLRERTAKPDYNFHDSDSSLTQQNETSSETIQRFYEGDFSGLKFEKWFNTDSKIVAQMKRATFVDKLKITRGRGSAMCFHPSSNMVAVIVGDKYGNIGFANITTAVTDPNTCKTWQKAVHSGPIGCLGIHKDIPTCLYSCSRYDGDVVLLDFEKGSFENVTSFGSSKDSCKYFDFYKPNVILMALRESPLVLTDMREKKTTLKYIPIPENKLRMINVHPIRREYFVTASSTGSSKMYDMRKTSSFLYDFTETHSIKSAFFSPITGTRVVTTAMNDTLNLWMYGQDGDYDFTRSFIRHGNHTGQWLTDCYPFWHPTCEDIFICGNLKAVPRSVDVFDDSLRIVHKYLDASTICSLNAFHAEYNVMCGVNSSGYLNIWAPKSAEN